MSEADYSLLPDNELIALTRTGAEDAFGELWKRYYGAAKARAWSLVNHADVDDVVSEAFLKTLEAIRRGKGPVDSFRPYLYVAIRTSAANRYARPSESGLEDASYGDASVEAAVIESADHELITQAFYAMEPRARKILWLWAADGKPAREIGAEMGLGARHVSTLLDRARKSFLKNWAQAHVNCEHVEPGTEHAWVLGHLGQVVVKQASPKIQERVDAHLETCDECRAVAEEVSQMWTKFGSALVASVAGVAVTALSAAPEALALEQDIVQPPDPPESLGGGHAGHGGHGGHGGRARHGGAARTAVPVVVGGLLVLALMGFQATRVCAPTTPSQMVSTPSAPASEPAEPAPVAPAEPEPTAVVTPTPEPTPTAEPSAWPAPAGAGVPAAPAKPAGKQTTRPAKPAATPSPRPTRAAITIVAVDAGTRNVCYPVVSGTALPGSSIEIGGAGQDQTVRTGGDGRWRTSQLTTLTPGSRTVVAEDLSGAQDPASGRVTLAAPPTLSATRDGARVLVMVRGLAGMLVDVLIDGEVAGHVTLDAGGQASVWQGLADTDRSHRLEVRYDGGGCHGPVSGFVVE